MRSKKGQVSAEFLYVLSALALIFLMIYIMYLGGRANIYQVDHKLQSEQHAYAISSAINYVHIAGDGAEYNFTLSGKSNDENITLSASSIESKKGHAVSQAPLLNGDVNTSNITGRKIAIKNNNGEIEIEQ